MRWPNLNRVEGGLAAGAAYVRSKGDARALLVLRDEDDACPRRAAPALAEAVHSLRLPFPAAIVLLHPEYEVLFLPSLHRMAGRPLRAGSVERVGLLPEAAWTGPWEARRGIKEWLTSQYPRGRAYKPTLDQLPFTRMIDIGELRSANVPCFGSLERGLSFLSTSQEGVYPMRAATTSP